jgi:DNA polymerase I-like protein with 3'-5' exonuclease and polymerase domains
MLEAMGFEIQTRNVHDTMVLAHIVTAGDELSYALKPLCKKYLAFPDDDEKELERAVSEARREAKSKGWLIAGGKKEVERGDHVVFAGNKPIKADYWLAPPEMCQRYAIGDVERAMMLYLLMEPELNSDHRLRATYTREMQLFWVLRKMEKRGTRVYPDWTAHLVIWYTQYMEKMRKMADVHGGKGMNFMSPKQLTKKFYTELGYTPMYTEKGNMTLGKDRLAELGATDEDTGEFKDPLAKAVLEWRAAKQSIKSFLNIYAKFWYPERHQTLDSLQRETDKILSRVFDIHTGVWILHPNYNQTGAVTGRMTCIAHDTPIEIARNLSQHPTGIPVQDVRPGNWAYCVDEKTGEARLRKVKKVWKKGAQKLVRVHWRTTIRTGYIDVTPDHNIWSRIRGWTRASDLQSGDRITAFNRGTFNHYYARGKAENHRVTMVENLAVMRPVYDLEIDEHHNFFAGELLVQNCSDPNLQQVASATTGLRKADIPARPRECFGPRPGCIWYLPDYCLHPDTSVWTLTGHKPIKDLTVGERVYSFNEQTQDVTWGTVTRINERAPLPAYRLTFDNGESIVASDDHKWPVQTGPWNARKVETKKTKDLDIGERMVPLRRFEGDGERPWFTSMKGTTRHYNEAHIVAEAFHGLRPDGFDVHHKDGDTWNNHPANLAYVESSAHKSAHAKKNYAEQDHTYRISRLREGIADLRPYTGEQNPNAKLTQKDYNTILQLARDGVSHEKIGRRFDVSQVHISRIVRLQGDGVNHKLVKKEDVGVQPMWTMQVDDHHNFALSCGVFSFNSQIEVWMFAFMSGDTNMQNLLLSGYDFHQGVADKSFTRKPDYEQRKKYYRKLAKLIMFGKLYGGGVGTELRPGRMTRLLQMPFREAKEFIDSFEEQFSSVVTFIRQMTNEATKNHGAWNLYGRHYKLEHEWAYKVVNYLIQGSSADLLKVATMRIDWMLDNRWLHPLLGLLNTIHDELIIEVPFELHSHKLMRDIVWVMQMDSEHCGIPVPLPVGMKLAWKRWSHTVDIALPAWVRGGVPRDEAQFSELREFMQDCPYKVDASLKVA